jgi:hypothetical protein
MSGIVGAIVGRREGSVTTSSEETATLLSSFGLQKPKPSQVAETFLCCNAIGLQLNAETVPTVIELLAERCQLEGFPTEEVAHNDLPLVATALLWKAANGAAGKAREVMKTVGRQCLALVDANARRESSPPPRATATEDAAVPQEAQAGANVEARFAQLEKMMSTILRRKENEAKENDEKEENTVPPPKTAAGGERGTKKHKQGGETETEDSSEGSESSESEDSSDDAESAGRKISLAHTQSVSRWKRYAPDVVAKALDRRYRRAREADDVFGSFAEVLLEAAQSWNEDPADAHAIQLVIDLLERILAYRTGALGEDLDAFARRVQGEQMSSRYKTAYSKLEKRSKKTGQPRGSSGRGNDKYQPRDRSRRQQGDRVPKHIWDTLSDAAKKEIEAARKK